jgi:hypothetical protein
VLVCVVAACGIGEKGLPIRQKTWKAVLFDEVRNGLNASEHRTRGLRSTYVGYNYRCVRKLIEERLGKLPDLYEGPEGRRQETKNPQA